VVGFGLIVTLAATVGVSTGAAVIARHRTEGIADVAALAAASRIGRGPDSCAVAGRIAAENGATLTQCSVRLDPSGRTGSATVTLSRRVNLPVAGARTSTARASGERLAFSGG
jgi:secretion/DNA translocation related TadE-like protein